MRAVDGPHLSKDLLANRNLLFAYILSLVRDGDLAEDIFQEVGLSIIGEEARGTCPDDFLAWARGICRFRVADHFRRHRREQRQEAAFARFTAVVDQAFAEYQEDVAATTGRIGALRRCLDRLSQRARQIVDARYQEALDLSAIAERIGWKTNAVKVALAKARQVLRTCIDRATALAEE